MRANNESLSNLRLYTDDVIDKINNQVIVNNSVANFLVNAGLAKADVGGEGIPQSYVGITVTRAIKVRLVAVGWSAPSVINSGTGGVTLEYSFDGNSFNISDRSVKPVRTRIPQKNYVLNQWFDIPAGTYKLTDVIPAAIGGITFGQKLYTCDGVINFVDIAVRY